MENCNASSINTLHHHIAVFAFPFGSHATLLLNIIRHLASLLPQNNVHFSFFSTPTSINFNFLEGSNRSDKYFRNIKYFKISDIDSEGSVFKRHDPYEEIDHFLKAAARSDVLRKVVEKAEESVGVKVKCVMGDAFLWFLRDLTKEIQVPWVPFWLPGEHALSIHAYTHVIRQRFVTQGIEEKEEKTMEFIPGLTKIRVKDIPEGIITGNCDSPFSQMLHKMSQVLQFANVICTCTCEELHPVIIEDLKSKFSNILTIGPLNLLSTCSKVIDTYNCLDWLEKQHVNSVVYVSFGSAATPTPNEIYALAEALQICEVKFLWSIKDHLKVHFPNDFIEKNREKGMVVPWVPQIEVLAHDAVGVFITHFGYHSILESIVAEVPMIGRPFFGDHSLNGRLVETVWEIGLQVDGGVFTKDGILKSLHRVLFGDEGKKMKENIKSLNKVVRKAVAPNGSSYNNIKLLMELIMHA